MFVKVNEDKKTVVAVILNVRNIIYKEMRTFAPDAFRALHPNLILSVLHKYPDKIVAYARCSGEDVFDEYFGTRLATLRAERQLAGIKSNAAYSIARQLTGVRNDFGEIGKAGLRHAMNMDKHINFFLDNGHA